MLLKDPYGNPVPGTESLAAYYASNPDISGGTYGGTPQTFQEFLAAPLVTDKYVYSSAGPAGLPQLDSFYDASEPGPVLPGDTGAGSVGSTFIGTDFTQFGAGPMEDYTSIGGVDFPSLRDIIGSAVENIPGIIESFAGGGIPAAYQRRAPSAPLLGGACPPGRVLRRISLGRDKCVKKAHMNVCNRHALARATRRAAGFLHLAKNTEKKMRHAFGGLLTTKKASSRRGGRCVGCGQTSSRCAC